MLECWLAVTVCLVVNTQAARHGANKFLRVVMYAKPTVQPDAYRKLNCILLEQTHAVSLFLGQAHVAIDVKKRFLFRARFFNVFYFANVFYF